MLGNIKAAFGQALGRELLEFSCAYPPEPEEGKEAEKRRAEKEGQAGRPDDDDDGAGEGGGAEESFRFRASGWVSNANYNVKKGIFMLFINNRLVRSIHNGLLVCEARVSNPDGASSSLYVRIYTPTLRDQPIRWSRPPSAAPWRACTRPYSPPTRTPSSTSASSCPRRMWT